MDATLLEKLERSVECDICQDPVDDPRQLLCHHTYCRFCIDDLLKFEENGAATVKCPNNCNGVTLIKQNETTKILPNNFALSNVLDVVKETNQRNVDNKQVRCHCNSNISKWCISCKVMFCNVCYNAHECNNKSFVNGYYSLVKESFQPLCEQHEAHITHVCLDCDHRFICCYCVHREHKQHKVDILEKEADKYKQEYLAKLDKINRADFDFSYDDVLTHVFKFENEFAMELDARIHLKISSFIKKLNKEKEEILFQYKQAANKYKQSINGFQLTHQTFKESLHSTKEYLNRQNAHEILASKVDLSKQIESITKLNVFKVSINENENCDSLGTLKTEILKKDLNGEDNAFDHNVNLDNKANYVDILYDSSLHLLDLQKRSKKLFTPHDGEKCYLTYNKTDINVLISKQDIQTLKKIILINPKILSDNLSGLIYLLIQHNECNVLDFLLKYYSDAVDKKVDKFNTPLLCAVKEGRTECVKVLLKNNANVQVRDRNKNACLHYAAENGHPEIINILLQSGADLNEQDYIKETPLLKATEHGHKECVNILLQNNADINSRNSRNNTCLHLAAEKGHHEILNILLQNGADVNCIGFAGNTPLIKAADNGRIECVDLLLQKKAKVNLKDNSKNTCLHLAAMNGHHEIVDMLLRYAANVNDKGFKGQTALDYARIFGNTKCIDILLKNNAQPNLKDDDKTNVKYKLHPVVIRR